MSIVHKFRPACDKILVQKLISEAKTGGGIYLSSGTAKGAAHQVNVIAVGPGRVSKKGNRVPIHGVKVGDVIVVNEYNGTPLRFAGDSNEYMLYKEGDVLGTIDTGNA